MRTIWRLLLLIVVAGIGFTLGARSIQAATTITSFTPGPSSVGRYQKYEATFTISRTFPELPDFAYPDAYDQAHLAMLPYYYYDPSDNPTNYPNRNAPYGSDGITIDALIRPPGCTQATCELTLPAFYYESYTRSGDVMTPQHQYSWKIRFAPQEIGTYTYHLQIQDKNGTWNSSNYSFASTSSSSKGFIRVSPQDSRFMAFDDGSSFIQIGAGRQWYNGGRVTSYESAFNSWGQNGINFTRIWDQNDSYALTIEGHFDKYQDGSTNPWYVNYKPIDNYHNGYGDQYNPDNLAKGTQINQRGAFEEDLILSSAEQNGVYIQLCSHGDPYWIWDEAVYAPPDGTNASPSDPLYLNYWKRNFRYRVARWGYSTSIMAWERWNEHGHVVQGSSMYTFYQSYGQYQQNTDFYHHLRTTSQGSQAFSPGLWSSAAFDLANYHDYMRVGYYSSDLTSDSTNFVSRFSWCLVNNIGCGDLGLGDGSSWSGAAKPWVWGELDVGTTTWDQPNPTIVQTEPRIRFLHNSSWAGLFSPTGTSPLDWYWDQEASSVNALRLADRKAMSNFFANVSYAGDNFTYLLSANSQPSGYNGETIGNSNATARALGMRSGNRQAAYLWVQNRNYTWNNSGTPNAISTTVSMPGLLNQSYRVEIWNTHTTSNQIMSSQTLTPSNGTLNISLSGITNDVAVKIISTSATPPTETPSQQKVGDFNGDGWVDFLDFNSLIQSFFQTGQCNKDLVGSTNCLIDIFDVSKLLHNLGV